MAATEARSSVLLERTSRFLTCASFNNQARVHGGYHYPRSVLTAVRARQLYARFHREFAAAMGIEFTHIYAIARQLTRVGAREFAEFCRRIGAPLQPAPRHLARRFDSNTVEKTFLVEEEVFDAERLAEVAVASALRAGARCVTGVEVTAVEPGTARRLRILWRGGGESGSMEADWVINASYASLNQVLLASGLHPILLIHELTELAIVRPPPVLRNWGVTIMDGPFWSCIPFPVLGAYSLSHVRYTPHARWRSDDPELTALGEQTHRISHETLMRHDAERFLPGMREACFVRSLWEIKTVLPRSDTDDGRPILVHRHGDAPGLVSVLGGKIDSVYDVEDSVRDILCSA